MNSKRLNLRTCNLILHLMVSLFVLNTYAQTPIGRLFDNVRMQSFLLYSDGMIIQDGNPANRGMTVRDPSGFMNLMIPSATPQFNAFFLNWNNQVVQIDLINGATIVGYFDCPSFKNPCAQVYQPPRYNPNVSVETNSGFKPFPQRLWMLIVRMGM